MGLVGVFLCHDGDPRTSDVHLWQGNEDIILKNTVEFFSKLDRETLLVTFNGSSFDIPFLERCAMEQGLKLSFNGYEHLDLMAPARTHLAKEGRFISMNNAIYHLGIYTPKTCDGFKCALTYKFPELASTEDWIELLRHNFIDLEQTARLYFEMKKWDLLD